MGYMDPYATDEYHHKDWAADSRVLFKKYRTQTDKDRASAMASVTQIEYDQDEAMMARLEGRKYQAKINATSPMSGTMALIVAQAVDWQGSEFVVPRDAKDRYGNPHNLAGRLAPLTSYWIDVMIPPEQQLDIELYLNLLYGTMKEEDVARFRARNRGVAGPEDSVAGPEGVAAGAVGDDRPLSADAGPGLGTGGLPQGTV